jgi:hypothetical protein
VASGKCQTITYKTEVKAYLEGIMKKYFVLLTLPILLLLVGCETLDLSWDEIMDGGDSSDFSFTEKYEPKYVLTFHQVVKYPRATLLEKKIATYDGRELWINTNYFLGSKNIKEVMLKKRPNSGLYDLVLSLDRRGRMQWDLLSLNFKGQKMALLVDGVFYRKITPTVINDESTMVILRGPFDTVTATGIQKNSKKNFEHYND